MVKNLGGGNKGKKGARRLMVAPQNKSIREKNPDESREMYACMMKLYGGSNCEVLCEDGVTRLCIIRNKFRGRSKQDNYLSVGSILLIGLRDWEAKRMDKKENCDLLCVYREDEKIKLISSSSGNWSIFPEMKELKNNIDDGYGGVFIEQDEQIDNDVLQSIKEEINENSGLMNDVMDEIDIDDI
jgi:translation initiation factor IF-1